MRCINFKNRKILYILLCVIIIFVFTLTMAYAALSVSLKIQGNAEVAATGWDVHFANINYLDDIYSPNISTPNTVTFSSYLNQPGSKYTFTVDIVNDGGIDAVIESIEKTSDLTAEQAKYLKYEITYANGDSIAKDQLVKAGKFVRVKVLLEYRTDVNPSDLPKQSETLNLSFKFNYVQSNGAGTEINYYGVPSFDIIDVTDELFGSEICLNDECFYVIEGLNETDEYIDAILLAKYNLNVGNKVTFVDQEWNNSIYEPLAFTTVKQDSRALGADLTILDDTYNFKLPWYGTIAFSDTKYWDDNTSLESLLYDNRNNILTYLYQYFYYLNNLGHDVSQIAILPTSFIENVCDFNECEYSFLNSTSYWLLGGLGDYMLGVVKDAGLSISEYNRADGFGIRPLIVYRIYK